MDFLLAALILVIFAGVHVWHLRDTMVRMGEKYRTELAVKAEADAYNAMAKHIILFVIALILKIFISQEKFGLTGFLIDTYLYSFPIIAVGHIVFRFVYAGKLKSFPQMPAEQRDKLAGSLVSGFFIYAIIANAVIWIIALLTGLGGDAIGDWRITAKIAVFTSGVLVIPLGVGLLYAFTAEFFRKENGVIWNGNPASTITGSLRGHTAVFGGGCSCGKPTVCTVAEAQQLSEEFRDLSTEGYYDLMAEMDDHQQRGHQ